VIAVGTRVRLLSLTGTASDFQRNATGRVGVVVEVGTGRHWHAETNTFRDETEYLVELPDDPDRFWWFADELEPEE
jgi:hypothetical protein